MGSVFPPIHHGGAVPSPTPAWKLGDGGVRGCCRVAGRRKGWPGDGPGDPLGAAFSGPEPRSGRMNGSRAQFATSARWPTFEDTASTRPVPNVVHMAV